MEASKPHAAIVASPGLGHLIPVLQLGKHLITHHNFAVTVFVVPTHKSPAESHLLHPTTTPPNLLNIVELPYIDISGLVEPDATISRKVVVIIMMHEARPALRHAISTMKHRPSILIVDLFGTESLVMVDEFKMAAKYVYIPSTAWFLALATYAPTLDKVVEGEYVDQKEPLQIPGCKPVRPQDVVDPMLDRKNKEYEEFLRIAVEIPRSDGILVNTWQDLEPVTLGSLNRIVKVPVYPIGPLVRLVEPVGSRTELLDWLDRWPAESVIYVSFGSGGTMSAEQMTELAWGLEMSQQRFIWVVRPPTNNDASASFFRTGNGPDDPSGFLPDGFLTRTHETGRVAPMWAPQMEVLSHRSIGAFLSHCGWNSTLESITNGVPMIAWPLYAEQRLNATMLTEELGVAVRQKELPTKKVVGREEIEMMVRKVMENEGNAMRDRVKKLQDSAVRALSMGGSSYNAWSQLAKHIEIKAANLQSHRPN